MVSLRHLALAFSFALLSAGAFLPAYAQQGATGQPSLFESLGKFLKPDTASTEIPPTSGTTGTSTRNLGVSASTKRIALIIGNDAYQHVPALEKAGNDARAMGRVLQRVSFETRVLVNATRTQMNRAINQFADDIAGGGIGVFFFAGHGVQVNNQNFLIPVDLQDIQREADVADQGVSLQGMQDKLAEVRAKFSLLVIDACRNNPLPQRAGRTLGGTRGLSQASSAEGQMVLFSAGANQQALDKLSPNDSHPNGLFVREFLPWVEKPGISIRDAAQGVRSAVRARARTVNHEQFPAIYDQAEGNFYFVEGGTQVAQLGPGISTSARSKDQIEDELWDAIKNDDKASVFEAYMREYPNGRYQSQARVKLAALKDTSKPTTAVSPEPTLVKPTSASSTDAETDFWNEVKASGAREYFDAYLKQYPKGKYLALAKVELKKIDDREKVERTKEADEKRQAAERERQEAQQAEQQVWDRAKEVATAAAYGDYLSNYPKGRFAALAQAAQQKVQRETTAREESEHWQRANIATDSVTVQGYLDRYPSGRYVPQARLKLAAVKREEAEMRPGKVFKDCADCPEMVILPAGSFEMGGTRSDSERPVHPVRIGKAFAMGKTEVTQRQWRAAMGSAPPDLNFKDCDGCPVERVSWNEANEFITKLNQKTGKTYRLPSEAEWEYACRAGGTHTYCGSDDMDSVTWYIGNSVSKTHPVAGKQPNAWGLYDMSGNVSEWVEDCGPSSYNSAASDGSAQLSCFNERRVLRGGSWLDRTQDVRSSIRSGSDKSNRSVTSGFRLARTL